MPFAYIPFFFLPFQPPLILLSLQLSLSSVFLPLSPAHRSLSPLFRTAITRKEEIPSDGVLIRPDREPAITGKKAQVLLSSEFSSTSVFSDFVQRSHRPFVVVKAGVYEKIWNDEIRPTMVSTVSRICFIGYGVIAVLRMEIGILFASGPRVCCVDFSGFNLAIFLWFVEF